jgi:hypothetical protein
MAEFGWFGVIWVLFETDWWLGCCCDGLQPSSHTISDAALLWHCEQIFAGGDQVHQRAGAEQPVQVLRQAASINAGAKIGHVEPRERRYVVV